MKCPYLEERSDQMFRKQDESVFQNHHTELFQDLVIIWLILPLLTRPSNWADATSSFGHTLAYYSENLL